MDMGEQKDLYKLPEDEKLKKLEEAFSTILKCIHPDPSHIADTPARAAKAFVFFTEGYHKSEEKIRKAVFDAPDSKLITIQDITLNSTCEHHLLPFFGVCHIGYIPKAKILGLSKFHQVVALFSRRLQLQERLTKQICDYIKELLDALGVVVIIQSNHSCSKTRGILEKDMIMKTINYNGVFEHDNKKLKEFLTLTK